jgi:Ser/Thr protein kinase RdoA (MazF antagonist)
MAAARAWLAEVEPRIPSDRRAPFNALVEQLAAADTFDDAPRVLVHPDAAPVNAILAGNGDPIYVDWTGAGLGPRVCSLANLLWSATGTHEGTLADRIDAVVTGYRAHVTPTDDELARLADAIRIRPLLFAAFHVRLAVAGGNVPPATGPWFPDRQPMERVADLARTAFVRDKHAVATQARVTPAPDNQPSLFGETA